VPLQTSTSWAAAAGKGLPPSTNNSGANGSTTTASKQLEQLNSVREALFSQDGWGGSNVKQDTAWDVAEPRFNGDPSAGPPKDHAGWGGPPKNDGTDLWRSTLSGQPPVAKPQSANPWGHTPQNPTDFKTWGEEEESASHGEPMWRPDQVPPSAHFSKQSPNILRDRMREVSF
jgi:trinucleotide repeat-containing gene 6 protein